MKKFEYKIVYDRDFTTDELNQFGKEGWELVAMFKSTGTINNRINFYFKREL